MSFSPKEIENKDFLITLRGYDKEEVKTFLKALAADYAQIVGAKGQGPSSEPAFQAWGEEMADLLQQAKNAAEKITVKATEEAGATRARAEDEAGRVREAARNAATRLTEEAERHSAEVRSEADRYAREVRESAESDASRRLADVTKRVEGLQATEESIRQRLGSLETMLSSMRQDLQPEGAVDVIDLSHQNAGDDQDESAAHTSGSDASPSEGDMAGRA